MSSVPAARSGKLNLKGGINLKSKKTKKAKKAKKTKKRRKDDVSGGLNIESSGKRMRKEAVDTVAKGDLPPGFQKIPGAGRLLTSGTTVYGKGTRFFKDAAVGDALMLRHPTSMALETRVIKMILSDESLGLSSGFSSDLISQTSFYILKRPAPTKSDVDAGEAAARAKAQSDSAEQQVQAYGTYGGGNGQTVTYRERLQGAHGSYKIVTTKVSSALSRSELLDLRSKKKGDRMCM